MESIMEIKWRNLEFNRVNSTVVKRNSETGQVIATYSDHRQLVVDLQLRFDNITMFLFWKMFS